MTNDKNSVEPRMISVDLVRSQKISKIRFYSKLSSIYVHFILNPWLYWLKISNPNLIISIEL